MLRARVITALILLAVLLPAVFLPAPHLFNALVVILVGTAGWEWARLNGTGQLVAAGLGVAVGASAGMGWALGWAPIAPPWLWAVTSLLWIVGGAWVLYAGMAGWQRLPQLLRLSAAWPILLAAWAALVLARGHGPNLLLSILALVWTADIAAYFGGRAFGRRKLAPTISPGKSWAGVYSGLVGVGLLAVLWFWADRALGLAPSLHTRLVDAWGWVPALMILAGLAAMSVVGDLFESLIKRSAGAKDSSALLPGHGGVLDRVDALLPVLPISVWLVLAAR